MSEDNGTMMLRCASCGIAEVDDIKLKNCTACYLVKYCSIKCQKEHRSNHKRACKKRAAELRDELLFKQPESTHLGDCPICCLPMPLDEIKSTQYTCCFQLICHGCTYANHEASKVLSCPFCRKSIIENDGESEKRRMKRVEANDPLAMRQEGYEEYQKGNYNAAFEFWTRAAKLGNVDAHFKLAIMYQDGKGVEQDREKLMYHAEEAAIGGHPKARYLLGGYECKSGNVERAVKHLIIAAKQGHDDSIRPLMNGYRNGLVSKEDLAATLRAHQAAVDATKSPQREAAEEFMKTLSKT